MKVSKPWGLGLGTAAAAVVLGTAYFYVRQYLKDDVWHFDLTLVNKSLGTAALLLLTMSMGLTAWAYFRPARARWLAYRKHFGLAGFWTGLAHGLVNHFALPALGLRAERKMDAAITDGPGLVALALFAALALISNASVKGRLGGERWRKLLRYGGYAGLVLAAAHAVLLKGASWAKYFRTFDPVLPSLSLPAALLGVAAVLGRLALWISARRRKA